MPPPAWLTQALAVDYAEFLPLRAAERRFGWVRPEFAAVLARFPDVFTCEPPRVSLADALATPAARTEALARVASQLRDEGLVTGWRDEPYEIYAEASGEPLARIERAAVKRFGIRGRAVHLNGIVETDAGRAMWVARRSATKATDPGKLDNLVGGGVAAGLDAWQTLHEGVPRGGRAAVRARAARAAARFARVRLRGRRTGSTPTRSRHSIVVLGSGFEPRNEDGEVAGFELLPFDAVREQLEVPASLHRRCRARCLDVPAAVGREVAIGDHHLTRGTPLALPDAGRRAAALLRLRERLSKIVETPDGPETVRAPVPSCTARGTCRWHILCGTLNSRIHVPIPKLSFLPPASPRGRSGRPERKARG